MTEQDLIDLGFKVSNVSAQESGDIAFRYYNYNLSQDNYRMCLISCGSDQVSDDEWFVSFFECDDLVYDDKEIVKKIIDSILNLK